MSATTGPHRAQQTCSGCAEDLGEDVVVLAAVAAERGSASMVRNINGVTVRVTVEAA